MGIERVLGLERIRRLSLILISGGGGGCVLYGGVRREVCNLFVGI